MSWEQAIFDSKARIATAEADLKKAKKQVKDLKSALEVFEDRMKKGEPWPGSQPVPIEPTS